MNVSANESLDTEQQLNEVSVQDLAKRQNIPNYCITAKSKILISDLQNPSLHHESIPFLESPRVNNISTSSITNNTNSFSNNPAPIFQKVPLRMNSLQIFESLVLSNHAYTWKSSLSQQGWEKLKIYLNTKLSEDCITEKLNKYRVQGSSADIIKKKRKVPRYLKIFLFCWNIVVSLCFLKDVYISPVQAVYFRPNHNENSYTLFALTILVDIISYMHLFFYIIKPYLFRTKYKVTLKQVVANRFKKHWKLVCFDFVLNFPIWIFYYNFLIVKIVKIFYFKKVVKTFKDIAEVLANNPRRQHKGFKFFFIKIFFIILELWCFIHIFAVLWSLSHFQMTHAQIDDEGISLWSILIDNYYFIVTTIAGVGFGDFLIQTYSYQEFFFVMLLQVIISQTKKIGLNHQITGICIFGNIMGMIKYLIVKNPWVVKKKKNKSQKIRYWILKREKNMNFLTQKCLGFFEFLQKSISILHFKKISNFKAGEFFPQISQHDQQSLNYYLYQSVLHEFPTFFSGLSYNLVLNLLPRLNNYICPPGITLIKKGSINKYIYLIICGEVKVSCNKGKIKNLRKGDFFGELALVEEISTFSYEVKNFKKSIKPILFYRIKISDMQNIINQSYSYKGGEIIKERAKMRLDQYKNLEKSITFPNITKEKKEKLNNKVIIHELTSNIFERDNNEIEDENEKDLLNDSIDISDEIISAQVEFLYNRKSLVENVQKFFTILNSAVSRFDNLSHYFHKQIWNAKLNVCHFHSAYEQNQSVHFSQCPRQSVLLVIF